MEAIKRYAYMISPLDSPVIRGLAGRGRPPQAAARRAGLEVVEKLLTNIEVRF
jgi:hypothetical protein